MLVDVYPEYMRAVCIKWSLWIHIEQWIYTKILNNCFFNSYHLLGRRKMSYGLLYNICNRRAELKLHRLFLISLCLPLQPYYFFSCVLTAFYTNWSAFPFPAPKETCCTQVEREHSGLPMRWCLFTQLFLCVLVFLFLFTAVCNSTWHSKLHCWPSSHSRKFYFVKCLKQWMSSFCPGLAALGSLRWTLSAPAPIPLAS